MKPRNFSFRAASVLVGISSIGLLSLVSCDGPSQRKWRLDRQPRFFCVALILIVAVVWFIGCNVTRLGTGPQSQTLTGCPTQSVAIGQRFTLTISSERDIFGVAVSSLSNAEEVVISRVDDMTFTAIVTPNSEGSGFVEFFIDAEPGSEPSCGFTVIADLGACCESISCEVTDSNECFFRDGVYKGAGTSCTDNPCVGACCDAGACSDAFLESECAQQGGDFRGDGSLCADTFCEEPLDGACCLANGSCLETPSELDCGILALNGSSTFLGLGTDCMSATCPGSDGACCIGDGSCVDNTSEGGCRSLSLSLGTAFQGAGSVCAGRTCTVTAGACCILNECVLTANEEECDLLTGLSGISSTFRGAGTPCVFPDGFETCGGTLRGACCWSFGRCEHATVERCGLLEEGVFIGLNVSCSDFERLPDTCTTR